MIQALQAAVSEPASRMRVATEFSKGKSIPELIPILQKEYQGGTGITTLRGSLSIWCDERGLALAHGDSAREHPFAAHFSWEEAAERIGSLLELGQYATVDELAQMENQERMELAQSLLYLRQDMTKEAAEMLPALDQFQHIWPENQQKLAEFLTKSKGRRQLQTEMERFSTAYERNPSLLRFPFHSPPPLLKRLQELEFPRNVYSSDLLEAAAPSFITQDEIDAALAQGSNMEGGRERITRYFAEKHLPGEKADFLKKEYGTGGRSHALAGKSGSSMDYGAKGIRLHKTGCPEVALKWNMVAQRMERLVQKRLLLSEEKQKEANSERPSEQQDFLPLPYRAGDTVYLDDTAFQITEVTRRHVQMQDLTLPYPLFRSENRNHFESLLRLDRRNQAIVDLLPAPTVDNALRDLLLNGILTVQMQEQIAGLLRGGVTNPSLAGWLAASFDQADAGSMTLETGEEADFFTGRDGFETEIQFTEKKVPKRWGFHGRMPRRSFAPFIRKKSRS